jgi:hypothetical protein
MQQRRWSCPRDYLYTFDQKQRKLARAIRLKPN